MARRSYLARLAQPLTAADPAVWSTPRASAEESRQTVPAIVRPAPKTVTAAPAMPIGKAVGEPGAERAPRSAARADALLTPAAPNASRALATHRPSHPAGPPIGADAALPDMPMEVAPPVSPIALVSQSPISRIPDLRDVVAAAPEVPTFPRAATFRPVPLETQGAAPSYETSLSGADPAPARRAEDVSPASRRLTDSVVMPEPEPEPPTSPSRPTPPRAPPSLDAPRPTASQEASRLHIGSIEIRVSHPPPAPAPTIAVAAPVAPVAVTPISRAYASRFGLAQG
jgi:hypothetical protein